jgi:hypothetical protein
MSELAFNVNGESFEVPANVTGWRVRKMKPRGAPELVYGKDGRPLTIPIESDMDELRDAVGQLGRYRLDPINDDGKTVESVPAAYIQVVKPANAEASLAVLANHDGYDDAVREAMRLNTELARSVIDRFPEMMTAAAELLRAADGAGLPARLARLAGLEEGEEGEDDGGAEVPAGFDLNAVVASSRCPAWPRCSIGARQRPRTATTRPRSAPARRADGRRSPRPRPHPRRPRRTLRQRRRSRRQARARSRRSIPP